MALSDQIIFNAEDLKTVLAEIRFQDPNPLSHQSLVNHVTTEYLTKRLAFEVRRAVSGELFIGPKIDVVLDQNKGIISATIVCKGEEGFFLQAEATIRQTLKRWIVDIVFEDPNRASLRGEGPNLDEALWTEPYQGPEVTSDKRFTFYLDSNLSEPYTWKKGMRTIVAGTDSKKSAAKMVKAYKEKEGHRLWVWDSKTATIH